MSYAKTVINGSQWGKSARTIFRYAEGKYIVGGLNITVDEEGFNVVSAEITFENKKLASVKLTTNEAIYSIEKFDATTITVPTNLIESSN